MSHFAEFLGVGVVFCGSGGSVLLNSWEWGLVFSGVKTLNIQHVTDNVTSWLWKFGLFNFVDVVHNHLGWSKIRKIVLFIFVLLQCQVEQNSIQRSTWTLWNSVGISCRFYDFLKPWPNGLTSQGKFAKPELVYRLVKGGQTDSQDDSQVHASHKRLYISHIYRWLVLGGQMVKLALTCMQIWAKPKSMQVIASQHKWVAKRNASWTQVEHFVNLRVCLSRALKFYFPFWQCTCPSYSTFQDALLPWVGICKSVYRCY